MFEPIHKLGDKDGIDAFDCGYADLNLFLKRYARINQKIGSSQTYTCCDAGCVVGYYSLTVGSIEHEDVPTRVAKGMPRYPIPVMILARLAWIGFFKARGLVMHCLKTHCFEH